MRRSANITRTASKALHESHAAAPTVALRKHSSREWRVLVVLRRVNRREALNGMACGGRLKIKHSTGVVLASAPQSRRRRPNRVELFAHALQLRCQFYDSALRTRKLRLRNIPLRCYFCQTVLEPRPDLALLQLLLPLRRTFLLVDFNVSLNLTDERRKPTLSQCTRIAAGLFGDVILRNRGAGLQNCRVVSL